MVSIGLRDDGMEVAVKRLLKSNFRCIKNELENLRIPELEHENIVKYRVSMAYALQHSPGLPQATLPALIYLHYLYSPD